jgi:hypothetical protein
VVRRIESSYLLEDSKLVGKTRIFDVLCDALIKGGT